MDDIYEAAAVPDLWPDVLRSMSGIAGSEGGLLFTANPERLLWVASPEIQERMGVFIRDGWSLKNPRLARMAAVSRVGFVRDSDCFSAAEMDSDPVYLEFWRKQGLGYCVGTQMAVPSGDSLIFSFERAYSQGPIDDRTVHHFDLLRPHLARAALFSARLRLERVRAMAAALQMLGLPGAVLRGAGQLHVANPLFEALMPDTVQDRRDRLHVADPDADVLLADALARISLKGNAPVNSIPVAARDGQIPLILHLLPVRGAAHDFFSQASALLIVTPIDRAAVPGAEVLQGLFDLTPSEARLAALIGQAKSPREAAAVLGLTEGSVRVTLKRVLAKTGLRRQAELVSLLGGKALGPKGSQQ